MKTSQGTEAAEAYEEISEKFISQIASTMFDFVLHDPVFSKLRRLMMIEQYRDPDIARRLNDYLIARPLAFQTELFGELMSGSQSANAGHAEQAALAFYGPIFLLIQMGENDEPRAKSLLSAHVAGFRRSYLEDQR